MYLSDDTAAVLPATPAAPTNRASLGGAIIRRLLASVVFGRLTVVLPSGERIENARPENGRGESGPHGTIIFHRKRALRRLVMRGDVGLAESFIDGDWSSPDLTQLIAVAAHNISSLESAIGGIAPVRLVRLIGHALRRNSARGSRRNIAFHYDLGNDFYRLWLDASMTYSAAIAVPPGTSLEDAQAAKLTRIADMLRLGANDTLLEVGIGWGALAARLGQDCRAVTGLTLSREQLALARARIAGEGLAGKVDLRLQDYRDVAGSFDRIVSIEMLEAVGEAYWPTYFAQLSACLAPGGRIVLQAITIREDRYASYRRSPDFIQRYIFPGGMLPTPAILSAQAAAAGLVVTEVQTFAAGYADTLAEWRRRFEDAWESIAALGFDRKFRRLWIYYLSYCEAGFRTGTIDVGLYALERAG